MEIFRVNKDNENEISKFIEENINVNEVELEIVRNASYVKQNDKIIGVLSYETFTNIGLIRYFVFKETIPLSIVIALLESVKEKAKEENIKSLMAIVKAQNIVELLISFGFEEIQKENIYIGEESILKSNYKDAHVLNYVI